MIEYLCLTKVVVQELEIDTSKTLFTCLFLPCSGRHVPEGDCGGSSRQPHE